ncbi:hypothetical protein [Streptomyces sp. AK08-02]|uniref:hypothetical protein n=1 Tax=Streptomyces sp. AK08-02 TaxID=3028654 RepID=UPI0029B867BF|nr:hypothetical protein [Streptomyces sp. AK08-02]MDX3748701.1 hypothetical protein [Streptomyces sp. AK08-02]
MYDLAPKNAPWFEHLTDSVRALGHAALEWQLAAQAAVVDHARADHPGLDHHDGRVTGVPAADAVGWRAKLHPVRPHAVAQRGLEKHYRDAMYATRHAYQDAARLYASGAAWAVREVQEGRQPERVEFAMTQGTDTLLVLTPGSERVGTEALTEARYSDAGKVQAAYKRLDDCLYAAQLAEDIGSQEYVADHEASAMHDAWTVAEGIADAAYDYGVVLEKALQFVLLGPKEEHRKHMAEQRAAEAAGTGEGDGQ